MTFGPSLLGPAELKLEAQRIPISYPEGFRGRASGTIRVAGDVGNYQVTGDIAVTQAYYTAEFDQRRQSLDRLDYQLAAIRGESFDHREPPARGERETRRPAAHPQQPGPARHRRHTDGRRHARAAGHHRPGEPARGRAGDRAPRAHPPAGWPRRAERLPVGRARDRLHRHHAGGRRRDEPARAGIDGRPPARHLLAEPARPLAERPHLAAPDGAHRPGCRVAERGDRGRGARVGPRRRPPEGRRRDVPDRRLEQPVAAPRPERSDAAVQRRHPLAAGPVRHLLDAPRRDGAAVGGRVEPPGRPLPAAGDRRPHRGVRGRADRPLQLQPVPPAHALAGREDEGAAQARRPAPRGHAATARERAQRRRRPQGRPPLRPAPARAGRRQGPIEARRTRLARRVGGRDLGGGGGPRADAGRPRAAGHARAAGRDLLDRRRPRQEGARRGHEGVAGVRVARGGGHGGRSRRPRRAAGAGLLRREGRAVGEADRRADRGGVRGRAGVEGLEGRDRLRRQHRAHGRAARRDHAASRAHASSSRRSTARRGSPARRASRTRTRATSARASGRPDRSSTPARASSP